MFKTILIANRGEIACRIIRTAKSMGIRTVAVHSDVDADAPHVELADEAVLLGAAPASESYLVIEKIIEACKKTGAEAVHPGYGFLSERTAFARALTENGITFIGPKPEAIDALGDKIRSKLLASKAGVTVVPGAIAELSDARQAAKVAADIGYPVLLKASAGGGGKGMRLANNESELAEALVRAQSEGKNSFGDDRVFMEKYIQNPRHIEIQVLGDKHGRVIHLGERECSIQRRHQKIIEEAPSPLLDAQTRAAMGAQAVALAQAVGYDSAGTVEFVVDQEKNFYFLEMNTRLQVEHPVTELVTGLDLVEWMIRIAAGEPLTCTQEDISLHGHAIEARVCAEDPTRGYLPATGRLSTYRKPRQGREGNVITRVDDGVREGSEISVYYDSLIAKVIAHAPTRAEATEGLRRALDQTVITGLRTNLTFLSDILDTPRWASGQLSTAFLSDVYENGYQITEPEVNIRRAFAAAALDAHTLLETRRRGALNDTSTGSVVVATGGKNYSADIAGNRESGLKVLLHGGRKEVSLTVQSSWKPGDAVWEGLIDGKAYAFRMTLTPLGFHLAWRGHAADVSILNPQEAEILSRLPKKKAKKEAAAILSPMPGVIRRIDVVEGATVRAGDPVLIIEAMKMENVLVAERDAVIKTIHVKIGDAVPVDTILVGLGEAA